MGYVQRRHDEGLMAVLRPCLPGLWTLVAKENGDAKTGMLGGIRFQSHKLKQASAEFCDMLLLLHTVFTIDLRSE